VSEVNNIICSRHDIAEILLELGLNTNQSIKNIMNCTPSTNMSKLIRYK